MSHQAVISIHEYTLKSEIEGEKLKKAYQNAQKQGLFKLPGLVEHHLLRGIRGSRQGKYATIWVYEDEQTWTAVWGEIDHPKPKADYPPSWIRWEDEFLAPLILQDPDKITYTSYRQVA